MHPKHDAVRMQGVLHRVALAQELGVPGDLDVDAARRQVGRPAVEFGRGSHRHGRFAHQDRRSGQPRHQRVDDRVHVAQVGAVLALLLRCPDPEEVHVGELGRHVVVGGEPQPPRRQVLGQQLAQAGLVERDVTAGELGDLPRVDVDADDLVSQLRHADGVGCTQVTGAEHGASHMTGVRRRHELTASPR
ncbi:hypothetical protein A5692_07550 [Mycobacterium sp. E342]|nr:hypothetical protein A5692_07550 [Mycobacterium sp. E342]